MTESTLRVALAQIAPVWLDRDATTDKLVDWIHRAGKEGAQLVCFGEALLPGSRRNTADISRFIAREARSFVVSVSGLMRASDIGDGIPHADEIRSVADETMADGGSCVVAPTGDWVLEPETGVESLRVASIDHRLVLEERQNLDVVGHYSRPDVTALTVDRRRQATATFLDDN